MCPSVQNDSHSLLIRRDYRENTPTKWGHELVVYKISSVAYILNEICVCFGRGWNLEGNLIASNFQALKCHIVLVVTE